IPALAPEDVNEVLGPAPGLGGMDHTAPHLTRAQALRVLDAARGRPARGLDCDGFGALLVRVAELGDPAGALARLADVEYVWELDRGKMVARLAAHLPPELLPRARALVQPDPKPVARLLARARLLAELPAQ